MTAQIRVERLKSRNAKAGSIGPGCVGLALCIAASGVGLTVPGFDIEQHRIKAAALPAARNKA